MAKKRFSRSFIKRILAIVFLLMVLPLFIYSTLIWMRDWKLRSQTIFLEFSLQEDILVHRYTKWLNVRKEQLMGSEAPRKDATISGLYIFDQDNICLSSTIPELVGKGDFFSEELDLVRTAQKSVFMGFNPYLNQEEVFIFIPANGRLQGMSTNQKEWFQELAGSNEFKLFDKNQIPSDMIVFDKKQLEQWQQNPSFSRSFRLRNHPLGFEIALPSAQFPLILSLSKPLVEQIAGPLIFRDVLIVLGVIILLGALGSYWLIRKMNRPFVQLQETMGEVAQGNFGAHYIALPFGFELNEIGDSFNGMVTMLKENIQKAESEKIAKELYLQELTIGQQLQQALLPHKVDHLPRLSFGMGFSPAKEVAGDFYDLFERDNGQTMLMIADGAGKGISACLYSLIFRSIFRTQGVKEEALATIIKDVNEVFMQDTADSGQFVTAWMGSFDPQTLQLHFSSAGHPLAIVIKENGELIELKTEGIALGVTPFETLHEDSIQLAVGDLLLLYTDGVIEAHNEKGELFGKSRLNVIIQQSVHLSPQDLIDRLLQEVKTFAKEVAQHDDIALLCAKVTD